MAFKYLEVVIEHFKCAYIRVFQRNQLKLNILPKLANGSDLFLHLCFIFSYFGIFFDLFLVCKQTQLPQQV